MASPHLCSRPLAGHRKRALTSLGDDSSLSHDGLGYLLKAEGGPSTFPSPHSIAQQ